MAKRKLTTSQKRKLIVLVVFACLLLVVTGITAVTVRSIKIKRADKLNGCSFSTEGFEEVKDAQCLEETIIVFVNSDGKKGIISLDGTITEKAVHNNIFTVSNTWEKTEIVAEGPLSEYLLTVDKESAKIGKKQYHKATVPEKTAYWDEEKGYLTWINSAGKTSEVRPGELSLSPGLHPISNSPKGNGKYGFINEFLFLKTEFVYDMACEYSEGLAAVRKGGSWGYIDTKGNLAIDFGFETAGENTAYSFRNGLAPAKKDGKYGIIDRDGNTVVSFNFEEILQGKDGKYVAKKKGDWGVLTVNEELFSQENTDYVPESEDLNAKTGKYKIKTSGSSLNMRENPDINSKIVTKITNGEIIFVTEMKPGWAYTVYNSKKGWVSTEYIVFVEK